MTNDKKKPKFVPRMSGRYSLESDEYFKIRKIASRFKYKAAFLQACGRTWSDEHEN